MKLDGMSTLHSANQIMQPAQPQPWSLPSGMSLLFNRPRSMNLEPQSTNCTEWLLAARSFSPVLTCSMAGVNLQQDMAGISFGHWLAPAMSAQLPAWAQVGLLQCD